MGEGNNGYNQSWRVSLGAVHCPERFMLKIGKVSVRDITKTSSPRPKEIGCLASRPCFFHTSNSALTIKVVYVAVSYSWVFDPVFPCVQENFRLILSSVPPVPLYSPALQRNVLRIE